MPSVLQTLIRVKWAEDRFRILIHASFVSLSFAAWFLARGGRRDLHVNEAIGRWAVWKDNQYRVQNGDTLEDEPACSITACLVITKAVSLYVCER